MPLPSCRLHLIQRASSLLLQRECRSGHGGGGGGVCCSPEFLDPSEQWPYPGRGKFPREAPIQALDSPRAWENAFGVPAGVDKGHAAFSTTKTTWTAQSLQRASKGKKAVGFHGSSEPVQAPEGRASFGPAFCQVSSDMMGIGTGWSWHSCGRVSLPAWCFAAIPSYQMN